MSIQKSVTNEASKHRISMMSLDSGTAYARRIWFRWSQGPFLFETGRKMRKSNVIADGFHLHVWLLLDFTFTLEIGVFERNIQKG